MSNLNEMISYATQGVVFHGTTAAAGVNVPASNTTSPTFGLWNPTGSLKNAVLMSLKVGWVGTTGAPGTLLYNVVTNAGGNIATGAAISAFNTGTPTNALVGLGQASVMRFAPAGTVTLGTAGSVIGGTGFSQLTITGASTAVPMWSIIDEINGNWVVPPGVFFYVTGSAALLSALTLELCWAELPVN